MKIGDEAGSLQYGRRRSVRVDGHPYPVMSVIWLWVYDYWPKGHPYEAVDHIDRNPLNNRITNLRLVNAQQNNQNKDTYYNSPFGVSGVTWHKHTGKYLARIKVNRREIHLGVFWTLEEAIEARKQAELTYFKRDE